MNNTLPSQVFIVWLRRLECSCVGLLLGICSTALAQQPLVSQSELPRLPMQDVSSGLASIEVATGFQMEAVAWEPLVMDPVAISFDEHGRVFVVEMRDYSERRPEQLGRVRLLEDRDGDGVMDWSSIYADGLPWPTAVICYNGGVFVGATPNIYYFKDHDGDGHADERSLAFTGFASDYAPYQTNRLNVQALMNSFQWGLDNRIHGVASGAGGKVMSPQQPDRPAVDLRGRDFSFDPKTLSLRAESGGGQHGMSFDDWGHKFVCSNSDHIQQVMYEHRYAGLNESISHPSARVSIAEDGPAAPVFRLSPDEAWRVIRTRWRVAGRVGGPVEGGGRPSGYFTGATGVTLYRGDQWPHEYLGTAIIGDCGSNLIHRKKLHADGVLFRASRYPADAQSEFVASRSNWFRPVQFANAPDGTLWVVDMSREIIEHPWSLPTNIKQHLDLNHGNRAGRLYRVFARGRKVHRVRSLGHADTGELLAGLTHANGWHRDTAARLLFERADPKSQTGLRELLTHATDARTRLHALYGLHSQGWLTRDDVVKALDDPSPSIRVHGLRALEMMDGKIDLVLTRRLSTMNSDQHAMVRQQLAHTLGVIKVSGRLELLYQLFREDFDQPWLRYAILNSIGNERTAFWMQLLSDSEFWLEDLSRKEEFFSAARMVASDLDSDSVIEALERAGKVLNHVESIRFGLALLGEASRGWGQEERRSIQERLQGMIAVASQTIVAHAAPQETVEALELLELLAVEGLPSIVKQLVERSGDSNAMSRVLRVGRRTRNAELLTWLEERFGQFTPEPRKEFLAFYFQEREELNKVLDWLDAKQITRHELTDRQRSRLLNLESSLQRERARRLLVDDIPKGADELLRLQPALLSQADRQQGKQVFAERCALCHQLDSLGASVGPAVTSMRGLRKRGMLEAILFPNRDVAPQFQGVSVTTGEGSTTGLLIGESDRTVTLRQAGGMEVSFKRDSIHSIQAEGASLMPEGLLEDLETQKVADLLDFLMYGDPSGE